MIVLAVLALVTLTILSGRAARRAEEAQTKTERALVNSFLRTIGVGEDWRAISTDEEREALWISPPSTARRCGSSWWTPGSPRPGTTSIRKLAAAAACGRIGELDPAIRRRIEEGAAELGRKLAGRLEAADPAFETWCADLVKLLPRMAPEAGAALLERLAPLFLQVAAQPESRWKLRYLAPLLKNVSPNDPLVGKLVAVAETGGRPVPELSGVLAVLGPRLGPAETRRLAASWAGLLPAAGQPDTLPPDFWEALRGLAKGLASPDAEVLANRLIAWASTREGGTGNLDLPLLALAERLDPPAAARVAERLDGLRDQIGFANYIAPDLAALARRLEPAAAEALARRLLGRLDKGAQATTSTTCTWRSRPCSSACRRHRPRRSPPRPPAGWRFPRSGTRSDASLT